MNCRRSNTLIIGVLIVLVIALLAAACSEKATDSSKKKLTQRQRDSVLAETGLPGSEVVGTVLETADSTEARAKRLDELAK